MSDFLPLLNLDTLIPKCTHAHAHTDTHKEGKQVTSKAHV